MGPNNAVVLLEMFRGERLLATGTGVLYRSGSDTFIVTAWHNVTGRHSETLEPLSGGQTYGPHCKSALRFQWEAKRYHSPAHRSGVGG